MEASTFYFPATVFFVLGGYSLSAALAAKPVRSNWSFYSARFKTLLPLLVCSNLVIDKFIGHMQTVNVQLKF